MIGIILISHGMMAQGMYESSKMFFGENIEQFEYISLEADQLPEEFSEKLKQSMKKVDTGDGILILCDLLGGTPYNQAFSLLNENMDILTGMNFSMLLELLAARIQGEINLNHIIDVGRNGILCAKENQIEYEEDFFL